MEEIFYRSCRDIETGVIHLFCPPTENDGKVNVTWSHMLQNPICNQKLSNVEIYGATIDKIGMIEIVKRLTTPICPLCKSTLLGE